MNKIQTLDAKDRGMSRWDCIKIIFVFFCFMFVSKKLRDTLLREVVDKVTREIKEREG
uniref:Uncharacterized protein n=1 Tax=viral metagenome TaxID=1070528 RepID=A0A6M3LQ95_9ZZZZ